MKPVCAYCETTAAEAIEAGLAANEDEALRFVLIGESQVLLCPACRKENAEWFDAEIDELLNGPVTFPPGVTALEHVCPEVEFNGGTPEQATLVLRLTERRGDYLYATCPHCQVTVRSLTEEQL